MPDAFGGEKKVSDLLELELGAVVSCHVVGGNHMQAFERGLGGYLSYPRGCMLRSAWSRGRGQKTDLARLERDRLDRREGL